MVNHKVPTKQTNKQTNKHALNPDRYKSLTCAEVESPDGDTGEKDELIERLDSARTGGGIAIESALSVGVAEESSLDRSFDDEGRSSYLK